MNKSIQKQKICSMLFSVCKKLISDGLLVRDINKNGQIDNGGELFGDLTTVDDTVASNGFEALKMFDKNQDGVIESYVAESDLAKRKSMVTQIIYVWTGVAEESSTARGGNISDSRKLEALEVITGREFNSAYGNNPVYQAGQYIEQAFNKLVEMYYAQLERQTTYAEMYQHLYQNMDIDAQGNICYDTKEIVQILAETYGQDKKAGKE